MTQDNRIRVCLKHTYRIFKSLALIYRGYRLWILNIERLPSQTLDSARKRAKGAAGRLKEEQGNNLSRQQVRRLTIEYKSFHMQSKAKNLVQILDRKLIQRKNVFALEIPGNRINRHYRVDSKIIHNTQTS